MVRVDVAEDENVVLEQGLPGVGIAFRRQLAVAGRRHEDRIEVHALVALEHHVGVARLPARELVQAEGKDAVLEDVDGKGLLVVVIESLVFLKFFRCDAVDAHAGVRLRKGQVDHHLRLVARFDLFFHQDFIAGQQLQVDRLVGVSVAVQGDADVQVVVLERGARGDRAGDGHVGRRLLRADSKGVDRDVAFVDRLANVRDRQTGVVVSVGEYRHARHGLLLVAVHDAVKD